MLQKQSKSGRIQKKQVGTRRLRNLNKDDSLEDFIAAIDQEFNYHNQLAQIKKHLNKPLLKGDEKMSKTKKINLGQLKFQHQVEIEEKLGTTTKAIKNHTKIHR